MNFFLSHRFIGTGSLVLKILMDFRVLILFEL